MLLDMTLCMCACNCVQHGQTALGIASYHGNQRCVELLIAAGAYVDMPLREVSVTSCAPLMCHSV